MLKLPTTPLVLPPLQYAFDALEPITSEETLTTHYLGHHKGYVDKYNELLTNNGKYEDKAFNYGGHVLHSLFWRNLAPLAPLKEEIPKLLLDAIKIAYGEINFFYKKLLVTFCNVKGSGWVIINDSFDILTIPNNDISILAGKPILVLDVFEHAYYLQYLNHRKDFFENIINIINWIEVLNRYLLT